MSIKSVVGVCGFGYSGSGAVLDMLKSYSDISVLDDIEFSLVYTPDGIEDLQRNISLFPSRYWTSDSALRRFIQLTKRKKKYLDELTGGTFTSLLNEYLNKIIQIKWKGSTSVHVYQEAGVSYFLKQRFLRRLVAEYEAKIRPLQYHIWPQKEMYFSYMDNDLFIQYSKEFIMGLLNSLLNDKNETVIIDQPYAANNPEKSFPFFHNPKAIIITRDPRDTYLLAKNNLGLCGSFVPTDNVEMFINYYKGLMDSKVESMDDRVLTLKFEDLIYNFEITKNTIENFVGCKKEKIITSKFFDPLISINNTQLWLKYPQFHQDILEIEKSLPLYLYDFSKYEMKPSFKVKSF